MKEKFGNGYTLSVSISDKENQQEIEKTVTKRVPGFRIIFSLKISIMKKKKKLNQTVVSPSFQGRNC